VTRRGPGFAVARLEAVAVEEAGNQIVAGDQHQLTHGWIISAEVLLRCPRRRLASATRCGRHPPQWTDENDLGRRVVAYRPRPHERGCDNALLEASIRRRGASQTVLRFEASTPSEAGSAMGGASAASCTAICPRPPPRERAPCSSALQAHSPQPVRGVSGMRIAGKPGRRH